MFFHLDLMESERDDSWLVAVQLSGTRLGMNCISVFEIEMLMNCAEHIADLCLVALS